MTTVNWKDINVAFEALKYSPECIYWKDERGYYKRCNYNVAMLAGEDDIKGILDKKDDRLLWSTRAEEIRAVDVYVMQNDKEIRFREEMPRPNGGTVVYQTIKRPLKIKDKIVGVVGYAIDITAEENRNNFQEELRENLKKFVDKNNIEDQIKTQS
jgi:PAS domain-containing protein